MNRLIRVCSLGTEWFCYFRGGPWQATWIGQRKSKRHQRKNQIFRRIQTDKKSQSFEFSLCAHTERRWPKPAEKKTSKERNWAHVNAQKFLFATLRRQKNKNLNAYLILHIFESSIGAGECGRGDGCHCSEKLSPLVFLSTAKLKMKFPNPQRIMRKRTKSWSWLPERNHTDDVLWRSTVDASECERAKLILRISNVKSRVLWHPGCWFRAATSKLAIPILFISDEHSITEVGWAMLAASDCEQPIQWSEMWRTITVVPCFCLVISCRMQIMTSQFSVMALNVSSHTNPLNYCCYRIVAFPHIARKRPTGPAHTLASVRALLNKFEITNT